MIFLLLNSSQSFIINEVKLINLVLMYVNILSKTTNYSANYDYLIVFRCKQKVPIFTKQHGSSPYSNYHVHVFVLTHVYSFLVFMPFQLRMHLNP